MEASHPDLELARAAARRDARATRELNDVLEREAQKALARMRFTPDEVAELVQRLRVRLFVEDGGRLDTYDGRGPIAAWFRAMIVHAALDERRKEARRGPARGDSALENVVKSGVDAELGALRSRYAKEFSEAFRGALGARTPRERTIRRLVYVDGLTAAQVGKVYGTHRVSVARWLGDVRRKIHTETLARLSHVVTPAEGASLIRLCWSTLDASIARMLADPVE